MVIRRIVRLLGRRRKTGHVALKVATSNAPVAAAPAVGVVVWESELRAIAVETSAWSVETGGDLFGRWLEKPIIFLATKAGPKAQRDNAHFRLDVDYLRQISEPLALQWALRYFGDWHSHHRLGLDAPSSGDRRRIRQVAGRNQFRAMVEIIVTTEGSQSEPVVRIHPWLYNIADENSDPVPVRVRVLAGVSPIREALLARAELPEQDWLSWQNLPLDRIRIGDEAQAPVPEAAPELDSITRDKIFQHLGEALQSASGSETELHSTPFGSIVVAKIAEPKYLAFAVAAKWPFNILEVHRLDRSSGETEAITAREGLSATDVRGIVEVFRGEKLAGGAR
jgi:hypothetical protein